LRFIDLKRIGLLGCGAIGTQIALAIDSGKIPATLTHVYDIEQAHAENLVSKLKQKPEVVANSHLLSSNSVELVVEAASQDAVRNDAVSILQNKKDMMIMSAGALLDDSVFEVISDACRDFGKTVYLPSGAIAGLDALKAVRDELESVVLVTTKNPNSLKGAPFFDSSDIDPEKISEPTILFDGTAKEAVSLFPKNVNVSALLSLVGLGANNTSVRVVADPNTDKNMHEINANGKFGSIKITVENVPDSMNPKTSRLATLSAVELLRQICTKEVQIGT
jgi:aspartate dehydrogenase